MLSSCSTLKEEVSPFEPFDDPAEGYCTASVNGKTFRAEEKGGLSIEPLFSELVLFMSSRQGDGFMITTTLEKVELNKPYDLSDERVGISIAYYPAKVNGGIAAQIASLEGFRSVDGSITFTSYRSDTGFEGTFEFTGKNSTIKDVYTVKNGKFLLKDED